MKKRYLGLLLSVTLLIGTALGAFIAQYVYQVNMGMRLVTSYEISLEWTNGTQITNYNWGNFNPAQEKSFDANFVYSGNVAANFTWNTTNLPTGWNVTVEFLGGDPTVDPSLPWPINNADYLYSSNPFIVTLQINLTEIGGATPNQDENFLLNFYSGPE